MNEEELVNEINELRELLQKKEASLCSLREKNETFQSCGLTNTEICRYSRQIFVEDFGVQGQLKLKGAKVLIVGTGGLGCPAALYLASAGIGCIGLVDYDNVEINNLHRQVLYTETDIGVPKVTAAAERLHRLNSNIKIIPYNIQLSSVNCLEIIKQYDIILDATDNVATRYLLNDACVIAKKPLVSGSALRLEGQLTVYNYNGPCYRCIFPNPPAPETVTNCGDGGVLGTAVGIIGVLQALETMKIILNKPNVLSGQLLLFDGADARFSKVKLRLRNKNCAICGEHPEIKQLIDYEQFCGAKANDKEPNLQILVTEDRISVQEYNKIKIENVPNLLIDVRSAEEFQLCKLDHSMNIPFNQMHFDSSLERIKSQIVNMQNKNDIVDGVGMIHRKQFSI
ncbi:adenylyltransferase and sulfurtransferase MOCS3-like isoform X2 [Prorops nasuta]|uniref:adenylyltransferase and sulfurtransferase MOCS3-like isoform X2 n=1 Tax=Prorops nasuta TaxID=863751 RepID=UPI0034CFF953